MEVNEKQKLHLIPKIMAYFKNNIKDKKIAIWGLAFKPNTDDIREAPALVIIDALLAAGAVITAYDPEAMNNVKELPGSRIKFAEHQYDALTGADALVIATEWSEFRTPDFTKMTALLKNKVIFDGRIFSTLAKMEETGFSL